MTDGTGKLPSIPYIGARPFRRNETIYGRAREARDLLSLLVGNRIVLLNSPSGAGKTSLIQASLIPRLEKRRFVVRPTIRVGAPAPVAGANRYLLSVMQSLEEGRPAAEQLPAEQLAELTLREYLAERSTHGAEHGQVLIFDQFEEVLTLDPTDEPARLAFFEQLGDALADEWLWALFAIREEYVAALEPYGYLVPSRFAISFRLALLGVEAAAEAIRGPAESRGVQFDAGVAEELANDLAKVIVQDTDGRPEERVGTSVEPVQLQVVCYRLWEKRFAQSAGGDLSGQRIGMGDVRAIGSIDRALEEYYDSGVARATAAGQVGERAVRSWVDTQLITRQGFRSQVLAGNEGSFGLNEATIDGLTDAYLVREERRRGMAWLELAHDRLIAPVRASNARWFAANLSPLQRQAEVWAEQGQPDSLLFRDADLLAAEQWAAANAAGLTENEQKFLESCREERRRAEERARQARRIRALAWVASGVGIVALALAGVAFNLYGQANTQAAVARTAEANAQAQLRRSESLRLASAAQDEYRDSAARGLLLAYEANARDDNPVTRQALRDGLSDRPLWMATLDGRLHGSILPEFNLDGTRILTTLSNNTTKLWDASGQLITTLEGRAGFSPDGSRILTASDDNTARLWDVSGQLLATLIGHDGRVNSAEFSPDGSRILTTSEDKTARLWDTSGQPLATLAGHTDSVYSAEFSPDGSRILTVSNDSTTRLWDANGQFITTLEDQSAAFSPDGSRILTVSNDSTTRLWDASGQFITTLEGYSLVFSPDGSRILAISDDNTARLWDATGKPLATLKGHTDVVTSAVFSPDGTNILTASDDGTARLWVANGQFLVALEGHSDTVRRAIFSPDGTKILTASGNTARLWDASGQPLADLKHSNTVLSVTFSRDGKKIFAISRGGTAWLWDEAGEPLSTLTQTDLYSAMFSPDGTKILTVSFGGPARLWAVTDRLLPTLKGPEAITSAVFSPDGTKILTVSQADFARLWDASGQPLAVLTGHMDYVNSMEFSPDGTKILTSSQDNTARLWDASGQPLATLKGHTDSVYSAVFSPDGTKILTASGDGTSRLWDASGQFISTLVGGSAVFSPDGSRIHTTSDDETVRLWDASGQPLATIEGHTDVVTSAVFSPDGSRILTTSADNTARLWDTSGQLLATLKGHTDWLYSPEFSPDGSRILTASDDGTARLWDASGQPLATLTGHVGPVYSAGFSPDGSRILTTSADNTARLWDASGQPLATLTGHMDTVFYAGFSPDSSRILTSSADNTARLWDVNGQLITTVEGQNAAFSPDGSRILTISNFTARQYLVLTEDLRRAAACRVARGLTDEEIARFEVPTPLAFDFAERQCPPVYSWQQGQ